jgi:hypothetical protein
VLVVIGIFAAALDHTTPQSSTTSSSRIAAESPSPETLPSEQPTPVAVVPADPCHVNGVTYCDLNPAVTEATISSTICVSGWTTTVRPPSSYTSPLKAKQMAAEHLSGPMSNYEEDHRVPLELGGAPSDPTNLSPEPHPASLAKDTAENDARRQVCDGADLRTVQAAFVARWLGPFPTYR